MSTGDDTLFARWSRRKQAMRKSAAARPGEVAHAAESSVDKAESADAGRQIPATDPATIAPPEPLPSLEDLTAESDLTAFLREGVPESLRKAALRKMWSLDPAIRDHVGLAECTWDFNRPGSIPGFGPIGVAPVAQVLLSRRPPEATDAEAVHMEAADVEAADPDVQVPSAEVHETAAPAKAAEQDVTADKPPQKSASGDDRAGNVRSTEAAQSAAARHGGMLRRE